MTIRIEQTELQSISQFSPMTQTLLTLIPQGRDWVEVMLHDKEHSVSFASEDAFIEELDVGLRGTSIHYLADLNLSVDVKKLMDMSLGDVQYLAHLSDGAAGNDVASNSLLTKNNLITNSAFNDASQIFQNSTVSQPLFWSATLNDNVQFYDLMAYCNAYNASSTVRTEAITWAQNHAQTLAEFAHYYCFYLVVCQETDGHSSTLNNLITQLTSVVLDNLDCPVATFELDQASLQRAIVQWGELGNTLGFNSLASGLLNVALNIDLKNSADIRTQAMEYIQQVQQTLSDHLASDSYVSQTGICRHYVYSLPTKTLVLNLDSIGCLSLFSDRPNQ